MKFPKKFFNMSLQEQESYLISELNKIHYSEDLVKKMLATVRGGYKYEPVTEIDRPDLLQLKGE